MTDAEQLAAIKTILRETFFDSQANEIIDRLIAIIETPEELARRKRDPYGRDVKFPGAAAFGNDRGATL